VLVGFLNAGRYLDNSYVFPGPEISVTIGFICCYENSSVSRNAVASYLPKTNTSTDVC
jgi:hypothetical protein